MRFISLVFIFFILIKNIDAQSACATSSYETPPSVEKQIQDWILKNKNTLQQRAVVTIPVVVHILYYEDEENVSDADVIKQIDILNRDFRRRNADTSETPSVWRALAADMEIEFCLAKRDTLGRPTNGITRYNTYVTSFNSWNRVKRPDIGGVKNWNPRKYLNIWVANLTPQINGHGTYPTVLNSSPNEDGIVINYRNFSHKSAQILGRIAVHEVGHWLNLVHVFGDTSATYCEARTDFVSDTPPQLAATYGCPLYPKRDECSPVDNGNMYMNYMDYTNDNCLNMFTKGQKARAWAALNLFRPDILKSDACSPPTPTDDVSLPPFSLSPNPSNSGIFKIDFAEIGADLTVLNIYGQVVLHKKNISETEWVDLSAQPAGLYFFNLKKQGKSVIQKAIIAQ